MEELSRNACDALEHNDFTAAALLARATVECAAFAWKLMETLDDRHKLSPKALNDTLVRMLRGSKLWADTPQAMQVLSLIDRMNKTVSGVRKAYDMLSEIAHPNWMGVFGMYARTDEPRFTAYFGRDLQPTDSLRGLIVTALLNALDLFQLAYNRISVEMRERAW